MHQDYDDDGNGGSGVLEELLGDSLTECYVFVVDNQGRLRTMLVPENFEVLDSPESVQDILNIFEIRKIQEPTLH